MTRRLLLALAALVGILPSALHPSGAGTPDAGPDPTLAAPVAPPAQPDSVFAPLDRPGPAFSVPTPVLAASLRCTIPPVPAPGPPRDPVLLLSSTGVDTAAAFDWNVQPALTAAGITYCTSNAPGANHGDIQIRAEFVAYALREVRNRARRPVAVIAHGQGALAARVALRFWPDLRRSVSDVIALAPPNQGTAAYLTACASECPPAYWQLRTGSMLVSAVNSRQRTFAGVDYTVISSGIDEVVTPQPEASALPPGPGRVRNVAVQDVCPGYVADHLGIGGYDAVAWAVAADALANPGPADPARVNRATCDAGFMPGIVAENFLDNSARAADVLEPTAPAGVPAVRTEPAPRCWLLAEGCLTGGAR